jgi:hypothetical protein
VTELGEDELVRLPAVARAIASVFKHTSLEHENISRTDPLRDAMKRARRLGSEVSMDALDEDALVGVVSEIFGASGTALAQ